MKDFDKSADDKSAVEKKKALGHMPWHSFIAASDYVRFPIFFCKST